MAGLISGVSPATSSNALRPDDDRDVRLDSKHKVFLSHSGAQKDFVEQLCVDLERCDRYPFFDKRVDSLPIGENFARHIFDAIRQCHVGVVFLSNEFLQSKWPMLELVFMVEEVAQRVFNFKIMPIFLGISISEFVDERNRERWYSTWRELASRDARIDIEKWRAALQFIRPINGLLYDGLSEVNFRQKIVEEICRAVPPETGLEDSYIQGKARLCAVILEKIALHREDQINKVCVLGLYGMSGIGKSSICKALCNELFTEFRGKVCHAELKSGSEEELLREVLKRLTDLNRELIDRWNGAELLRGLKAGIIKEAAFLALDNMSDANASINQAKTYLSTNLPRGSIVMVTARSKETLRRVRRYIDENNCMEMPELEMEEAKTLFAKSSDFESKREGDEQLIERCVKRCRFRKPGGSKSYHYHPLALDVLGRQLALIESNEWGAQLDKIDEGIFNQLREKKLSFFLNFEKEF